MQQNIEWYKLSEDWNAIKDIAIYGFGRVAERNMKKLASDFNIKLIIDNNPKIKQENSGNFDVFSLNEAVDEIRKYKVIVTTSSLAYSDIKRELEELGMTEYIDFCRLETFMLEWYWKNKNQVCISQVVSSITTRCTFKCKYCSNLMPYFTQHYEYDEKDIYDDLNLLFKKADYLASYYILGGEPLLNKNLPEILEMVCDNFADRIGYIQIITNGSIIPSETLLNTMKKNDIKIRISDYTRAIPYRKKFEEVIRIFDEYGIEYSISDYKVWSNLGFPHEDVTIEGDIIAHMQTCAQGCHNLNDKKFYFCGTLWDAEKSGLYKIRQSDYIDLTKQCTDINSDKLEFLKYCLGISGMHIGLCEKCRGYGADNHCLVTVAEQI